MMRMIQKYGNEQLKAGLFALLMSLGILIQAQTEFEITKSAVDNDNRLYFQDIAIENGLYTALVSDGILSDGIVTSLYSGYFLNHWLGARSGVSLIMDLKDDSPYIKIPCLIALRTPKFRLSTYDSETFNDFLLNLFLSIIPTRFEVNAGPSFGYVLNNRRNFASSIDFNLRIGFQIWRIGIYGNMGANYLWTKNFVERSNYSTGVNKRIRPVWYANLSGGLSFRF
jgi:hypothetical protein